MASSPPEILQRLMAVLGLETQAELSASLGIKPQSIVSAMKRGEIPDGWLYRVAYTTGRSVDWLRTGKGSSWQGKTVSEASAPQYKMKPRDFEAFSDWLATWKDLDDQERATVRRCAEVLRAADDEIREHVIGEMKLIEEATRRRRGRKGRRPHGPPR